MKKIFTILFTMSCFLVNAADLYVLPNASAPYYASISDAVTAANTGDRVLIAPGTYIGNITISGKTITLSPMESGNDYSIAGDLFLDQSVSGDFIQTIIGANLNGSFLSSGTTGNTNAKNLVNIIDCFVVGNVQLNSFSILVNMFYSTFSSNINLRSSNEIVGNVFLPGTDDYKELNIITCNFNNGTADNTIKIFANHFKRRKLYIWPDNSYSWLSDVHLANNYFDWNNDGNASSQIMFSAGNDNSIPYLIENNTFRRSSRNTNGAFININSSSNLRIRNNIFYDNDGTSSYRFQFSTNTILIFEYNLFNQSSFTLNSSNWLNGWFGDLPSSYVIDNNYFNSETWNTSNISGDGILSTADAINRGKDVIECRDIEDTRNDLGTFGGPHAWENYHHTNTVGSGQIIDIDMPFTIYGLPGVSLNIDGKSVNTNK